jgi:hypothetical protein
VVRIKLGVHEVGSIIEKDLLATPSKGPLPPPLVLSRSSSSSSARLGLVLSSDQDTLTGWRLDCRKVSIKLIVTVTESMELVSQTIVVLVLALRLLLVIVVLFLFWALQMLL